MNIIARAFKLSLGNAPNYEPLDVHKFAEDLPNGFGAQLYISTSRIRLHEFAFNQISHIHKL